MQNSKESPTAYDERAQLVMRITYVFASALTSALAIWIGWIKGSFFGAGIGFCIYLAVANAGTLLSLVRKPELLPFFFRVSKYRAAGCGIGALLVLASVSGDVFAAFVGTIVAIAASMITNELTLMSVTRSERDTGR